MSLSSNLIQLQGDRDAAMLNRHYRGGDTATILINSTITVTGLVDNETDMDTFQLAGVDNKFSKRVHVLGRDMAPYVFGQDYQIGCAFSINGDNAWQVTQVTQSADSSNLISFSIITKD